MIFVTLGTSKQDFSRIVKKLDDLVINNIVKEEVIVQSSKCDYIPKKITLLNELSNSKYQSYIKDADIVITHGGVGSIFDALKHDKKIISFPRLKKYKEAVSDHQKQIVDRFYKDGYLLTGDIKELDELILKAKTFKPKEYKYNNDEFNLKLTAMIKMNNF